MSKKKALSLSAITSKGKFHEKEETSPVFDVFNQNVEIETFPTPQVQPPSDILKQADIELLEAKASVVLSAKEDPKVKQVVGLQDDKLAITTTNPDLESAKIFEELYWAGRKNKIEEKNFKNILEKESGREGYVIIPDALSFAINKFQVPPRAKTVLQVMIRYCLGYKVSNFELGYSYFVKATGIEKPNIAKAIQKLEMLNIIQVENYINPNTKILSKKYNLEFIKPFISSEQTAAKNEKKSFVKEIPESLYKYFYSKNLNPSEWEKALELWNQFKEFHTEEEIHATVEYVYQKGMVGGEFEGKRPVSIFGYLQKSFPYVLSRVEKSIKSDLKQIEISKTEEAEKIALLEAEKRSEETRQKFNNAFPTEIQKAEALKQLVLKYREVNPTYPNFPIPEPVLIFSWAAGELVI